MALIRCPECHKKVSDTAEKCPHCGYDVGKGNSANVPDFETETSAPALFSTKGLYQSTATAIVITYSIIHVLGTITFAIIGVGVGGIVFYILYHYLMSKKLKKYGDMNRSYVTLYEEEIRGLTTSTDNVYGRGTHFTALYQDITHMDNIADSIVVIHTTHGDYHVQAYKCADNVISMIQRQKEKVSG